LVDPQRTPYPRSGHTSTIDQAHIRESPPVRDRRPYHWATPQRRGSVVRTSVCSWRTFPDLRL